jgi:hypothetical protein
MVNSAQLVEQVALSLGQPVSSTRQHARNLREASLMTHGGRGRHAAAMTREDAAALICAVLGSDAVYNTLPTIGSLRGLTANSPRRWFAPTSATRRMRPIELALLPGHDVVAGLSEVLRLFDEEQEYVERWRFETGMEKEIYAVLEVQYPQHFASLTVGVRDLFSETWTYGRRHHARTEQIRRCRQAALREISACLR